MDLKKTEATLKALEKNALKVSKISDSVEKFQTLVAEADKIHSDINKNNSALIKEINNIENMPKLKLSTLIAIVVSA